MVLVEEALLNYDRDTKDHPEAPKQQEPTRDVWLCSHVLY